MLKPPFVVYLPAQLFRIRIPEFGEAEILELLLSHVSCIELNFHGVVLSGTRVIAYIENEHFFWAQYSLAGRLRNPAIQSMSLTRFLKFQE